MRSATRAAVHPFNFDDAQLSGALARFAKTIRAFAIDEADSHRPRLADQLGGSFLGLLALCRREFAG